MSQSRQMLSWVWGFLGAVVIFIASRFSNEVCFCLVFMVPEVFLSVPAHPQLSADPVPQTGSLPDLALPQQ